MKVPPLLPSQKIFGMKRIRNFKMEKEIEVIYNFVDAKRFNKKPVTPFRQVIAPNNERILFACLQF